MAWDIQYIGSVGHIPWDVLPQVIWFAIWRWQPRDLKVFSGFVLTNFAMVFAVIVFPFFRDYQAPLRLCEIAILLCSVAGIGRIAELPFFGPASQSS